MLLFFPLRSHAHQLSVGECNEAGDFIKNAALARDGGISEAIFIDKIRDDIEVIRAFPPQLRWFVQDDDARLLLAAAAEVFQRPKEARVHQVEFFKSCMARAKMSGGARRASM